MRMRLLRIVCLMMATAVVAAAQPRADEKDAEKAFRDSLANQLLIARGFSAEPEVEYQWTAQGPEPMAPPRLRTLGSIEVVSVKVKGGRIEIKGMRQTLLRQRPGGDLEVSDGSPVVLTIELGGADVATVLPRLKEALFYASLEEALAAVPPIYRRMVGFRVDRAVGLQAEPTGDQPEPRPAGGLGTGAGARPMVAAAARRVCPADPLSFTRPKVVHSADAEMSEEARRAKISGNVMLALTVDKNGDATDLWVIRPAGYGLDEQAAKSVRQYQFNPAMCAGEPVDSSLEIDVTFKIF